MDATDPHPAVAPGAAPPTRPLAHAVVRGSTWLVVNSSVSKGLSLLAQVILAKLLTDHDFGVYAIAISLSLLVAMFKDGGVRQLLIQRPAEYERLIGPVFWMAMVFNLLTAGIMGGIGPAAARLYDEPRLASMLWIIALSIPLSTPGAILAARLNSELKFRELAIVQIISSAVRYGGSVALALAGAGPLSFVLPLPVIALVEWGITYVFNRERLWTRSPRPEIWLGLASQTFWVLVGSFAVGATNMGNYVVAGLFVSGSTVGIYFFAYQIVLQIGAIVTTNINQVLFPAMTSMGDDRERQNRASARSIRQLMLLGAPLGMGLIPTFGPIEQLVWQGKWRSAVLSVCIIAAFYPATVINAVPFAALQAWGRFRLWAILLALQAAGMMAAGAIGARLGGTPESISLASGAYIFLSALVFTTVGLRPCGLSAFAILIAALPAWALSLACSAAAWLLVQRLAAFHPLVQLLSGGCVFVALYALATRLLLPVHLREALLIVPSRLRPLATRLLLLPAA